MSGGGFSMILFNTVPRIFSISDCSGCSSALYLGAYGNPDFFDLEDSIWSLNNSPGVGASNTYGADLPGSHKLAFRYIGSRENLTYIDSIFGKVTLISEQLTEAIR